MKTLKHLNTKTLKHINTQASRVSVFRCLSVGVFKCLSDISDKRGQSLMEVIIAMAIFALIGAALATMILGGSGALLRGGEHTQAQAISQEGIEAVRSIRDRAWNELIYTQSAVTTSLGAWIFSGEGTNEKIGKFTRDISFSDVCRNISNEIVVCPAGNIDINSKKVSTTINWSINSNTTTTINRVFYLTNWDSKDWMQTNWSGGSGQAEWLDSNKYNIDDNKIDLSTSGTVKLKRIEYSKYNWEFITSSSYNYDVNKIQVINGDAQLEFDGGGSYYSDNPWIEPKSSYSSPLVYLWTNFIEKATKNGGEIYYQLSDDDGQTWYYLNNKQWVVVNSNNQYNTSTEINNYILDFSTSSKKIMYRAFLHSNGTQDVKLDRIDIGYVEEGQPIYVNSSSLQSSAFKANNVLSKFQIIEWSASTSSCSSLCEIKLQVRTADSSVSLPSNWTNWYGNNGSGSYFTTSSGNLLPLDLNNKQWVEYRVELVGDGNGTPILEELKINYK